MNFSNLKRNEKEIVITETCAITVEKLGRGSTATVTDSFSPYNGEYVFASTAETAFSILKDKLAKLENVTV